MRALCRLRSFQGFVARMPDGRRRAKCPPNLDNVSGIHVQQARDGELVVPPRGKEGRVTYDSTQDGNMRHHPEEDQRKALSGHCDRPHAAPIRPYHGILWCTHVYWSPSLQRCVVLLNGMVLLPCNAFRHARGIPQHCSIRWGLVSSAMIALTYALLWDTWLAFSRSIPYRQRSNHCCETLTYAASASVSVSACVVMFRSSLSRIEAVGPKLEDLNRPFQARPVCCMPWDTSYQGLYRAKAKVRAVQFTPDLLSLWRGGVHFTFFSWHFMKNQQNIGQEIGIS
jgi:hypothetical protein